MCSMRRGKGSQQGRLERERGALESQVALSDCLEKVGGGKKIQSI